MKYTRLSAVIVGVLLAAGLLLIAGCNKSGGATPAGGALTAKDQPVVVGQSVAVPSSDQKYYLAKVTKIEGGQITVDFADGMSSGTAEAAKVRLIPNKSWAIGDKVMAAGSSGVFSLGEIVTADPDMSKYIVKFDDGNQNAEIGPDRIMAR